jgi:hypothetical protein
MPDPQTSILLRKGPHDSTSTNNTTRIRYALQCDNFSIQIAKTPIQIPAAGMPPVIIDIGFHRPSISINGTIPTVGNGTSSATGYEGMASFNFTRGGHTNAYYFPYKNILEQAATTWVYTDSNELEIEIGDAATPTGDNHTGGGFYVVAIQQCRFQIDASKEDRWTFAMQFVCKSRDDIEF